jgi:hypothetical protein
VERRFADKSLESTVASCYEIISTNPFQQSRELLRFDMASVGSGVLIASKLEASFGSQPEQEEKGDYVERN